MMKKATLFLILSMAFSLQTFAHKEWIHQYITKQAYLLLESQVGPIPGIRDAIGLDYHGSGDPIQPWQSNFPIGVGSWLEDSDDPIYGYNIFKGGTASVTHFWKADNGDDAATYMPRAQPVDNYPNAWMKAQLYLFGNTPLTLSGLTPINPTTNVADFKISYTSLIDLAKGSYHLYSFRYPNRIDIIPYSGDVVKSWFAQQWAYQILGRVAHLLQDMSVPAHAHGQGHPCPLYYPDYYENSIGNVWPHMGVGTGIDDCEADPNPTSGYYPAMANWTWKTALAQGGLIDDIACRDSKEFLKYLFYTQNQLTDFFPSGVNDHDPGSASGSSQVFQNGNSSLPQGTNDYIQQRYWVLLNKYAATNYTPSSIDVNDIADETLNYAIRATASLLYWFAIQTGQAGTPVTPSLTITPVSISNSIPSYKGGTISTNNNLVSVETGGSVNFIASQSILLQSGFNAKPGSNFQALIRSCDIARQMPRLSNLSHGSSSKFGTLSGNIIYNEIKINTDSIKNNSLQSFKAFPIPASDELNIEFNAEKGIEITIFDINGKIITNSLIKENNENIKIDTHEFLPGFYFVQLKSPSLILRKKIVIEHKK